MSPGTIELKQTGKLRPREARELHLSPMSKLSAPTEGTATVHGSLNPITLGIDSLVR